MRNAHSLAVLVLAPLLGACAALGPRAPATRPSAPPTVPPAAPAATKTPTSALRFGDSGKAATVHEFLDHVADSDLVVFGEHHEHPVGSAVELEVLEGLSAQGKPLALAMEFFERDQQKDLDAYLAGTITEAEFKTRTKRPPEYDKSHRPLIEYAKAHGFPVIAANAPRRLVTAYRKASQGYEEWTASLPEADRAFLPRATEVIEDAYRDRFLALMGAERGPRIFKAQSLWDDSMSEAIADFRSAHPERRVLLVVGAFHVLGRMGTVTKYLRRRPSDHVALLVMAQGKGPDLSMDEGDRGAGDVLLLVPPRPPSKNTTP